MMIQKSIKSVVAYIASVVVMAPVYVFASGCEAGKFCNPLKIDSFTGLVQAILKVAVYILFPVAVLFLIYSGFLFITALGNFEKLTKAKNNFLWTLVGMTLLLGAFALSTLIKGTIDPIITN